MDVRVTAALEKRLTDLAAKTGREPAELLEDAIPSCAKTRPVGLRGVTIIELEHAAEPLTALDRA
jgi:predicted transcriptional regulator